MCGILTYISNKELQESTILSIKNLMHCRGPDDQSYKKFSLVKKLALISFKIINSGFT